MCTVTYLPIRNGILLTSNRDEKLLRAPALLPDPYEFNSGKILFPKDGEAGGTWVAIHNNGNAMVLLNGAYHKHVPRPPYRKSRGLVFLDIFDHACPKSAFESIELDDIEPFTLVIWECGHLWEARWDGQEKYMTLLPVNAPRIWSSVTLYDDEVVGLRKAWFERWLRETSSKTAEAIRQFHEFGGNGNENISLKMNRDGKLQTVSITGIEITDGKVVMHYKDLLGGLVSVNDWYIKGLNP
jgi:hypothetical protein